MSENIRFQDEFFSTKAVEVYYDSKMASLDEMEVKLIIESLRDLGKLNGDAKLGTLVDIGCGYGVATSIMAKHFQQAIGIDTSLAQVEKARRIRHPDNVEFKVGSAESIPVADASVDVIIAIFAAQNFEPAPFAEECRRVLKPQGVAVLYSDFLSNLTLVVGNDKAPPIADEIKAAKDDCYLAAKALSHPVRHILNHSHALFDSIVWEGKSRIQRTGEVVCSFAEVRDYYLGIPAYANLGTAEEAPPLVRLFEKIKNIWGIKDGEESNSKVRSSFLASMIILNDL